jgi:hypothetical protein
MSVENPEHDLVMQVLRAAGAETGAAFVLAAETTGHRELDFLLTRGVGRQEVHRNIELYRRDRWEQVIVPNAEAAAEAARRARETWPGVVVLNMAGLDVRRWRDDPDLNQDAVRRLHMELKNMIFDEYVTIVVAGPEWAYARGERNRVRRALEAGLPVYAPDGRRLDTDEPRDAVRAADETIRRRLGEHAHLRDTIDQVLPGVAIEA